MTITVESIQRGSTTTTSGTTTQTISTVDTSRSLLIFTVRSDTDNGRGVFVRGRILSSTSLEFVVHTFLSSATTVVEWQVMEFGIGVVNSIQSGELVWDSTNVPSIPHDITLSPAVDRSKSLVFLSSSCIGVRRIYAAAEIVQVTNPGDTLRLDDYYTDSWPPTIRWTVIEFTGGINVQWVPVTLGAGLLTNTGTITAVDTSKTFLLGTLSGSSRNDVSPGKDAYPIRFSLQDSTTVHVQRGRSEGDSRKVVVQVAELTGAGQKVDEVAISVTGTNLSNTGSVSGYTDSTSAVMVAVPALGHYYTDNKSGSAKWRDSVFSSDYASGGTITHERGAVTSGVSLDSTAAVFVADFSTTAAPEKAPKMIGSQQAVQRAANW